MPNHKATNYYFIGEQDGDVERVFKNKLSIAFEEYSKSLRAYLTKIKYDNSNSEYDVALCLKIEEKEDLVILDLIEKIFKSIFSKETKLDILFLSELEELGLRKICCPFFTTQGYIVLSPDFYLISQEGYDFGEIISCFKNKKMYGEHFDGYLLCDIRPYLIGQKYGRGYQDVKQLIFAVRHKNYSLFPISDWPVYVHVAIQLNSFIENQDHVSKSDMEEIGWGELIKENNFKK